MPTRSSSSVLRLTWLLVLGLAIAVFGSLRVPAQAPPQPPAAPGSDFLPRPPVVRQDPAVQQRLFQLPEGYRIDPVLTDPLITDPVGVTFDGNGRMYVLQMRSYMLDAAGTGMRAPISRISRHEDTNGDGVYDRHTVFADNLVLPRIAFPLQDGVLLVLETDNRDLYKYSDTNGDGVSDTRELFYAGYGRVTNMEWQPGGMAWPLDNWLYTTYNPFRLRIQPDGSIIREETDPNGGQWWISQDNYGKLWMVDGGGELGPVNIQAPIIYGAMNVADNFEPDFQVPWPAPGGIADMQGGMNRVRLPDGTLNHFTAASGVEIYRGHRLPSDMIGDLLFNEPVGRIVRRAKVVEREGLVQLQNAYPKSEFIRSTDPLFRPVSIHNAPDGTLYLVDLYTGIIQDAQFVGPYLRAKVQQYGLDRQHNWGRIWRISHESMAPDFTRPQMYTETSAQLVAHLAHPSGWWRDTTQKLLVLRRDASVEPALRAMAQTSDNQLARIHALWTLEGLGRLDATLARALMKDADPKIRIQAIRASETLFKAGDQSFAADYRAMTNDADHTVVIQAMMTMNLHRVPEGTATIKTLASSSAVRGIREIGNLLLNPGGSRGQMPALADAGAQASGINLSTAQRRSLQRGQATYRELCITCHGADAKGAPMGGSTTGQLLAPPLAGAPRVLGHREGIVKVLLHGLTGPLDGKEYSGGIMVPMGSNTDEWIADVASYVRNAFGNSAEMISTEQVAAIRKATARTQPWTQAELEAAVPAPLDRTGWRLSASHGTNTAANILQQDANPPVRWESAAPQVPGMWFQVELPQATRISEIIMEVTVPVPGRFGGGGRGRGAMPTAPPANYSVQVSTDGSTWSAPVAQGPGQNPKTTITFAPVEAKFVRITQTGTPANPQAGWAIQRLTIFRAGE
ncbi:MAG: discoidin domain-containing protein [Acidobacteria bacterium]|nr:discoidin domain-containing protein [Acidobacteriota bacterium]